VGDEESQLRRKKEEVEGGAWTCKRHLSGSWKVQELTKKITGIIGGVEEKIARGGGGGAGKGGRDWFNKALDGY